MSLALSMLHDRDRVNIVEPGRLHPAVSFARASTATYMGPAGTLLTAAANQPRYEYDSAGNYRGLLIEEARTNALLNSATVATQNITVTAVARTLSFYGTGTITLSGAYSGSLVGTGASNRVTLTFTPAAGTLTLTVSGSCTNGQLETGAFATSYIPTTSAAVTRSRDVAFITDLTKIGYNATEGAFFARVDSIVTAASVLNAIAGFDDGTNNNRIIMRRDATNAAQWFLGNLVGAGSSYQSNMPSASWPVADTAKHKLAYAWKSTGTNAGASLAAFDGALSSNNSGNAFPTTTITQMRIGDAAGASSLLTGHIEYLTYVRRQLPGSELQRLTA